MLSKELQTKYKQLKEQDRAMSLSKRLFYRKNFMQDQAQIRALLEKNKSLHGDYFTPDARLYKRTSLWSIRHLVANTSVRNHWNLADDPMSVFDNVFLHDKLGAHTSLGTSDVEVLSTNPSSPLYENPYKECYAAYADIITYVGALYTVSQHVAAHLSGYVYAACPYTDRAMYNINSELQQKATEFATDILCLTSLFQNQTTTNTFNVYNNKTFCDRFERGYSIVRGEARLEDIKTLPNYAELCDRITKVDTAEKDLGWMLDHVLDCLGYIDKMSRLLATCEDYFKKSLGHEDYLAQMFFFNRIEATHGQGLGTIRKNGIHACITGYELLQTAYRNLTGHQHLIAPEYLTSKIYSYQSSQAFGYKALNSQVVTLFPFAQPQNDITKIAMFNAVPLTHKEREEYYRALNKELELTVDTAPCNYKPTLRIDEILYCHTSSMEAFYEGGYADEPVRLSTTLEAAKKAYNGSETCPYMMYSTMIPSLPYDIDSCFDDENKYAANLRAYSTLR